MTPVSWRQSAVVVLAFLLVTSSTVPFVAVAGARPVGPTFGDVEDTPDGVSSTAPTSASFGDRVESAASVSSGGRNNSTGGNTGFEPWYFYFLDTVNPANGNVYLGETDLTIGVLGGDISFTRSYNSKRSGEHGPLGFGWTHSYNARLIEQDNGSVAYSDPDGSVHIFEHTGSAFVAPSGVHLRLTETATGYTLERLSGHTLTFTGEGTLVQIEDKNGVRIHLTYTNGRLTAISDDVGQQLTLQYNRYGRLTAVTDPLGRTVQYRYAVGDLVEVVDPRGNATRYEYYENHKLKRIIDANGFTRQFEYKQRTDRVTCLSLGVENVTSFAANSCEGFQFTYDDDTRIVDIASQSFDARTTVTLNAAGNPTRISRPESTREMEWDADMNMVRLTNRSGTTTFTYDGYGHVLSTTDALGNTVRQQWNVTTAAGAYLARRTARTDARAARTKYEFDSAGNLIGVKNPLGATRTFAYDANGNRVSETDFAGQQTTYTYDAHGFLTSQTGPTGATTTYESDAVGRYTHVTGPRGNTYQYTYNAVDDVTSVTDPTGNVTRFTYDTNGALANVTTATGQTISVGGQRTDDADHVTIDDGGNIIGLSTDGGRVSRSYDALNRLTTETYAVGQVSETLSYAYDSTGNLVSLRTPSGITRYTYDALGQVTRIEGPTGEFGEYVYDDAGRRVLATFSNGLTVAYGYDAADRLVSVHGQREVEQSVNDSNATNTSSTTRTTTVVNETLFEYRYTYDAGGNRLSATNAAGEVTEYEYDALDRLIGVRYSSGKELRYSYDAIGNRLTRTVNRTDVTTYTYNAEGELTAAGSRTYTYDAAGNRVGKTTGPNTTTYQYDEGGRLSNVTLPSGELVSFTYLPTGQRIRKTTSTGTSYYLYSGFDVVAELDSNGTVASRYLHGPGVDELVSLDTGGETYFHHYDGAGNLRVLTNATGAPVGRYNYDPFGRMQARSETASTPYRFAGRQYDSATGLYYNRLRYYDPEVGQFARPDPAGVETGVNRYAYADNNPITARDPMGLDKWVGSMAGGGAMFLFGYEVFSGLVTNTRTGQTCSVYGRVWKLGGGAGVSVGGSITLQEGPSCGSALEGSGFSVYTSAGAGCVSGGYDVNTETGDRSGSLGPGECGANLEAGGAYTQTYVRSCSCVCDCPDERWCSGDGKECDDDDDDDDTDNTPNRPPGGDHPDDNHDLSVLSYDVRYPQYDYDGVSVAVLSHGFAAEMTDLLVDVGYAPAELEVTDPRQEYDQYEVLIIPTGGLMGLTSLTSFERKLAAYVDDGGTLIVMPQQRGYQWGPVPGTLGGYGWIEDQSCQFSSVGLTTACAASSSLDSESATVNVDGYFTRYPENATVILSRTVNGQPAMLTYDMGDGRVLATTVYTDWAYGNHASTDEGEALLENIVHWGMIPHDVPTLQLGEREQITLNATSYVGVDIDSLNATLVAPDGTKRAVPVTASLAPFETSEVNVTYDVPGDLPVGIYDLEYTLANGSLGDIQRVRNASAVAVSKFNATGGGWTYPGGNISFAVTSDAERYADGSNATFRVTIRNSGTSDETVTAWWAFPHNYGHNPSPEYGARTTRPGHNSALNETVVVPAGGERTLIYEVPIYSYDRLWAQFYRGDSNSTEYLGRTSRAFYSFDPRVAVDVTTDKTRYFPGETIDIALNLSSGRQTISGVETEVRVLGPESTLVEEMTLTDTLTPGNATSHALNATLQPTVREGYFTVVAEPRSGGEKIGFDSAQFSVPPSSVRVIPEIPAALDQRSQLGFDVVNVGSNTVDNATFNVSLTAPNGTTRWSTSRSVTVVGGQTERLTFPLAVGALRFGEYRLDYTLSRENGRRIVRSRALHSRATTTLEFDDASYVAGDVANLSIGVANTGRFESTYDLRVAVAAGGFSETSTVTVRPGTTANEAVAVPLPTGLTAGEHPVTVTLGLADSQTTSGSIFVPPADIRANTSAVPGSVAAGSNVAFELTNTGGTTSTASCTVELIGPRGVVVGNEQFVETLLPQQQVTAGVTVPTQSISGGYFFRLDCSDAAVGDRLSVIRPFSVTGLSTTVASTTDRAVYAPGENVTVTVALDNEGTAIENGTITLTVIDPTVSATEDTTESTSSAAALMHPSGEAVTRSASDAGLRSLRPVLAESSTTTGQPLRTMAAGEAEPRAATVAAPTMTYGDLNVTGATTWRDQTVEVTGNLTVAAGGNLTVVNSTLLINNTADFVSGIEVRTGGEMGVYESAVTATNPDYEYWFRIRPNARFDLRDSTVSEVGNARNYDSRPLDERGLYVGTTNASIENATIRESVIGLVIDAEDLIVANNTVRQNDVGVLVAARNVTLANNAITDNGAGLRLRAADSAVVENEIENEISVRASDRSVLRGNTVSAGYREYGISVDDAQDVVIDGNQFTETSWRSEYAVSVSAADTVVTNNTFTAIDGIQLRADGARIARNTFTNNRGVYMYGVRDTVIEGNLVTGGSYGVYLGDSTNTSLLNNTFSSATNYGAGLFENTRTTFRNNAFNDAPLEIATESGNPRLGDFVHDLDTSNTLDGKPIHYLLNQSDSTLAADGGAVWLVNATNVSVTDTSLATVFMSDGVTVRDSNTSHGVTGVSLLYTNETLLSDITATHNTEYGIQGTRANHTTVRNSTVTNNRGGIYLEGGYDRNTRSYRKITANVYDSVVAANAESDSYFDGNRNINFEYVHGGSVVGNEVSGAGYGIDVSSAENVTVRENTVRNARYGISASSSPNVTIRDNEVHDSGYYGIQLSYDMRGALVAGNNVTGSRNSNIDASTDGDGTVVVRNNRANESRYGSGIRAGSNVLIERNVIAGNDEYGVTSGTSDSNVTVEDNDIVSNGDGGIEIRGTDGTVLNNRLSNNTVGIKADRLSVASLDGNEIAARNMSIRFVESSHITVRNHTLGRGQLYVTGDREEHFFHDVDGSNTINGAPIVYRTNETDTTIDGSSAGAVWVANATNVTVRDAPFVGLGFVRDSTVENASSSNGYYGAVVIETTNTTVTGVRVENTVGGLRLERTQNVTLRDIAARDNHRGLHIVDSYGAVANGSRFVNNTYGVYLEDDAATDRNHTIEASAFRENRHGVYLWGSDYDLIRGNRFTDNTRAIYLIAGPDHTRIRGNHILNSSSIGVYHYNGRDTVAFNNYLANNRIDWRSDSYYSTVRWSIPKTPGENIVGGPFLGGNYWDSYDGVDTDGDGLGDTDLPRNDDHPLVLPEPASRVVWETDLSVNAAAGSDQTISVEIPGRLLNSESNKLKLTTALASATNQTVAVEDLPFYAFDGDTVLTTETDKGRYTPNETVTITGELRNDAASNRTYSLALTKDGTNIHTESVTLAPSESYAYSTTTSATTSFVLEATAGGVTIEDTVSVVVPSVNATIVAPDTVGRAPFDAGVRLENTGTVPVSLDVVVSTGADWSVTVPAGESRVLLTETTIDSDTDLTATISGDIDRSLRQQVTFGEQAVIGVTPATVYGTGIVSIPYTIENTDVLETRFDATFTLDNRTVVEDIYLPAGSTTDGTLVFNLTAGTYSLGYESPFETVSNASTISVAERNQIRATTSVSPTANNGTITVTVDAANEGTDAVTGTLRATSSILYEEREFAVPVGSTNRTSMPIELPVGTTPGTYNLTLEYVSEGTVLLNETHAFTVTGPQFTVAAAPEDKSYTVGDEAQFNISLRNVGSGEGATTLNVTVPGVYTDERTVRLTPGERRDLTVGFLVPEDLPEGTYDLHYEVSGLSGTAAITVVGLSVSVTETLDKAYYQRGTNATLALAVENERARDLTLVSRVKYNDYEEVREFDLAGAATETLTFEIPVTAGNDRKAFYSVYTSSGRSLYINGVYLHEAGSEVTLWTDKQVYEIGETATIHLDSDTSRTVNVYGPSVSWSGTVDGQRTLQFTVPKLRSGSYNIVYAFDNTTRSYPIDVSGYQARVIDATLNASSFTAGQTAQLDVTVDANDNLPTLLETRLYNESDALIGTHRWTGALQKGENQIPLAATLPANATDGVHAMVYRISATNSSAILLASGTSYFDVSEDVNQPPIAAFAYNPQAPIAGQTVTFDARGSSDPNGNVTAYAWDLDNDGMFDASGSVVTRQFATAGEYRITLRVTDDGGRETLRSETITVQDAPTTPGGGGSPSTGTPNGAGPPSNGGTPPSTPSQPRQPPVEVKQTGADRVSITVRAAPANSSVPIEIPASAVGGETGGQLTELAVNLSVSRDFAVTLESSETPPSGTPGVETLGDATGITYLSVGHTTLASETNSVTFTFEVNKDRLRDRGLEPTDVRLYRHVGGRWTVIETEVTGETASDYVFRSVSPGLSVFAIGAQLRPELDLQNVRVTPANGTVPVETGVTIAADVTNVGTANGSLAVTLAIDGRAADRRTVTVPAGDTRTVTFTRTFEDPGEYRLSVNDQRLTVTVVDEQSTADPKDEQPVTEISTDGFGVTVTILVVLLLLCLLAGRSRR